MSAATYHARQLALCRQYPGPRPRGGDRLYTRKLNLVLDAETHDRVMDLAEQHRVNVPEMVRTLLQWGLDS